MRIIDFVRVNNAPRVEFVITDSTLVKIVARFELCMYDEDYPEQAVKQRHGCDNCKIFNISPVDEDTIRVYAEKK